MTLYKQPNRTRGTALLVALCLTAPLLALPLATPAAAQIFGGQPAPRQQTRQGMSTRKKVVLVAGAALLYYLYRKHQARKAEAQQRTAQARGNGGGLGTGTVAPTTSARMPQLYRSKNGGVYYRDPQGRPVWLTAPSRGIQVPADELRRYAPDYNRYRGPAPAVPRGGRSESFEDFDESLLTTTSYGGGAAGRGGSPSGPSGPGRY